MISGSLNRSIQMWEVVSSLEICPLIELGHFAQAAPDGLRPFFLSGIVKTVDNPASLEIDIDIRQWWLPVVVVSRQRPIMFAVRYTFPRRAA